MCSWHCEGAGSNWVLDGKFVECGVLPCGYPEFACQQEGEWNTTATTFCFAGADENPPDGGSSDGGSSDGGSSDSGSSDSGSSDGGSSDGGSSDSGSSDSGSSDGGSSDGGSSDGGSSDGGSSDGGSSDGGSSDGGSSDGGSSDGGGTCSVISWIGIGFNTIDRLSEEVCVEAGMIWTPDYQGDDLGSCGQAFQAASCSEYYATTEINGLAVQVIPIDEAECPDTAIEAAAEATNSAQCWEIGALYPQLTIWWNAGGSSDGGSSDGGSSDGGSSDSGSSDSGSSDGGSSDGGSSDGGSSDGGSSDGGSSDGGSSDGGSSDGGSSDGGSSDGGSSDGGSSENFDCTFIIDDDTHLFLDPSSSAYNECMFGVYGQVAPCVEAASNAAECLSCYHSEVGCAAHGEPTSSSGMSDSGSSDGGSSDGGSSDGGSSDGGSSDGGSSDGGSSDGGSSDGGSSDGGSSDGGSSDGGSSDGGSSDGGSSDGGSSDGGSSDGGSSECGECALYTSVYINSWCAQYRDSAYSSGAYSEGDAYFAQCADAHSDVNECKQTANNSDECQECIDQGTYTGYVTPADATWIDTCSDTDNSNSENSDGGSSDGGGSCGWVSICDQMGGDPGPYTGCYWTPDFNSCFGGWACQDPGVPSFPEDVFTEACVANSDGCYYCDENDSSCSNPIAGCPSGQSCSSGGICN